MCPKPKLIGWQQEAAFSRSSIATLVTWVSKSGYLTFSGLADSFSSGTSRSAGAEAMGLLELQLPCLKRLEKLLSDGAVVTTKQTRSCTASARRALDAQTTSLGRCPPAPDVRQRRNAAGGPKASRRRT